MDRDRADLINALEEAARAYRAKHPTLLGPDPEIHHEELEDGDKQRPSAFPKIMLKQTDSGIQQLHGTGKRTQDQQRRHRQTIPS
jgi:hypothetical protein